MSDIRLVPATINLVYEEVVDSTERFEREFNEISEVEENLISQGIKHAKSRQEMDETNILLINLMAELYRKMDKIEQILLKGESNRISLASEGFIQSIGLEHFKLNADSLESGKHYYGRIEIATFPRREIALYFEAVEPSVAKIEKIHVRDKEAWGYYMTACERSMIRQMKGL
jgi:hypothetical protein